MVCVEPSLDTAVAILGVHLRRAPSVRENVVVAKELDGEKALVAYFAGDAEQCGWGAFDHIEHSLADVGISAALLKLVVGP